MSLLNLPTELLLSIARNLDSSSDISALSRTSRALHNSIVSDYLYEYNIKYQESWGLSEAAYNNDIKLAQRLLDKGANVNAHVCYYPLYVAVEHSHEKMVRLLLDHGAKINMKVTGNSEMFTPVCLAADNGNVTLLQMLLEHAGDGWIQYLESALHSAARCGHKQATRVLLDKYLTYTFPGPDYRPEFDIDSALRAAERHHHDEIAQMLCDAVHVYSALVNT